MIGLAEASAPISPFAAELLEIGVETIRLARFLRHAKWLGWQEDGAGGRMGLWNLTQPVGPHNVGSTVSTQTLERYLFPQGYGAVMVSLVTGEMEDFKAVESPIPLFPEAASAIWKGGVK